MQRCVGPVDQRTDRNRAGQPFVIDGKPGDVHPGERASPDDGPRRLRQPAGVVEGLPVIVTLGADAKKLAWIALRCPKWR